MVSAGAQLRNAAGIGQEGRFILPVRYVAEGAVVQTTSTIVRADAIHVRSVRPPQAGRVVGLKLAFGTLSETISVLSMVAERTFGSNTGFWAEFAGNDGATERIAASLARYRGAAERISPRFATQVAASLRRAGKLPCEGRVTNLSRTGAFVEVRSPPGPGSIVELDLAFPGQEKPDKVLACVVHVASPLGMGIQFAGASDEFRARLDRHLIQLAGAKSQ